MSNRITNIFAGALFLIAACIGLYRLMVGFPIVVAGVPVGHTASFLTFAISAALSFMFFKAALART